MYLSYRYPIAEVHRRLISVSRGKVVGVATVDDYIELAEGLLDASDDISTDNFQKTLMVSRAQVYATLALVKTKE